jgi:hypothetical protein
MVTIANLVNCIAPQLAFTEYPVPLISTVMFLFIIIVSTYNLPNVGTVDLGDSKELSLMDSLMLSIN